MRKGLRARLRARLRAGVLLGALALAGCVNVNLGGAKAVGMLIRLTPQDSAPAAAPAPTSAAATVILVTEPETDRSLAVTRVPVQVDDTRLAYLADVAWVDRPSRLFRGLLAEALREKGGAVVIEDDQPAPPGARRLSGRLLAMGYDARTRSVVVRYDALWPGADGRLMARRFEALEPNVRPQARAVAPALNRAANDVAAQVAGWALK
jgi:cholesterol transport system auxiliary component